MTWENPEPGVHELRTTRTTDVVLEVYEPEADEEDERVLWWALSEGRAIALGTADSVEEGKRLVELAIKR